MLAPRKFLGCANCVIILFWLPRKKRLLNLMDDGTYLVCIYVFTMCVGRMMETPADEEGQRGVIINTASVAAYEGQVRGKALKIFLGSKLLFGCFCCLQNFWRQHRRESPREVFSRQAPRSSKHVEHLRGYPILEESLL